MRGDHFRYLLICNALQFSILLPILLLSSWESKLWNNPMQVFDQKQAPIFQHGITEFQRIKKSQANPPSLSRAHKALLPPSHQGDLSWNRRCAVLSQKINLGLRECCIQVDADMVSNISDKIHQIWEHNFNRALYRDRLKGFGQVVWMLQASSGRSGKQQH